MLATKLTIKAANVGFQVSYADIFKFQTPEALEFFSVLPRQVLARGCRQSEIKNYGYSKINNILSTNTIKNLKTSNSLGSEAVGDIL